MKLDIEQQEQIKEMLSTLSSFDINTTEIDGLFDEEDEDIESLPDDLYLGFPDDQEYTVISLEEFMEYMSEYDSLKRIDRRTVMTKHYSQTVITSSRKGYSAFEDKLFSYSFKGDGIEAYVVDHPFLIGVMNSKEHQYDDDFGFGACEPYLAIEIHSKDLLKIAQIKDIVERICFFLSYHMGVDVCPSEIANFNELYYRVDEFYDSGQDNSETTIDLSSIPEYSPLLTMYRLAKGIEDSEMQYLQYYKMIEYVSRPVAKKVAYNGLKKQIETIGDVEKDSKNLDAFISVFKQYDKNTKDDSLALLVLENCTDYMNAYEWLPMRLKKQILDNIEARIGAIPEEGMTDVQKTSLRKQLAAILYATRNRIVHAKANYEVKGNELTKEELDETIEMMDVIAGDILKWNMTQVDGFRS